MLIGDWNVVCTNGHVDKVDGMTWNHNCGIDGLAMVSDGGANVQCPHCGQVDLVGGVTEHHNCSRCHLAVRLDDN